VIEIVLGGEVSIGAEDPEGDWEIKTGALFSHVSRSQVDSDFLEREKEAAVSDRCPNAFTGFANCGIWQTNDCY
jgi:hypothetical protein